MCCIGSIVTGILLGMGLLCMLSYVTSARRKGRGKRHCCQGICCERIACRGKRSNCEMKACCEKIACDAAKKLCCEKMSCCTKQCCVKKACCAKKPGCAKGDCKKACCVKSCCRKNYYGSGGWRHPTGSFGHNSRRACGSCSRRGCGKSGYQRCGYRHGGARTSGSGQWRHQPSGRGCGGGCESRGLFGGSHRHYRLLSSEDENWIDGGGDCERIIALHDLNSYAQIIG